MLTRYIIAQPNILPKVTVADLTQNDNVNSGLKNFGPGENNYFIKKQFWIGNEQSGIEFPIGTCVIQDYRSFLGTSPSNITEYLGQIVSCWGLQVDLMHNEIYIGMTGDSQALLQRSDGSQRICHSIPKCLKSKHYAPKSEINLEKELNMYDTPILDISERNLPNSVIN